MIHIGGDLPMMPTIDMPSTSHHMIPPLGPIDPEDMPDDEEEFGDDGMMDEEEDEEYAFDDELVYEPGLDDDGTYLSPRDLRPELTTSTEEEVEMISQFLPRVGAHRGHGGIDPWQMFTFRGADGRPTPIVPTGGHRSHHYPSSMYRTTGRPRAFDEGVNPLLQRTGQPRPFQPSGRPAPIGASGILAQLGEIREMVEARGDVHSTPAMINELTEMINSIRSRDNGGNDQFLLQMNIPDDGRVLGHNHRLHVTAGVPGRGNRLHVFEQGTGFDVGPQRASRSDPFAFLQLDICPTIIRWTDEAKILFAGHFAEKATVLFTAICNMLVPAAREAFKAEQERQKQIEEERREKERQEQEAREANEKKQREEREAREQKEKEEREAELAAELTRAAEAGDEPSPSGSEDVGERMAGIEVSENPVSDPPAVAEPARPRIMRMIPNHGEVDIGALGIDPSFFDAVPPDMHEDMYLAQIVTQRDEQRARRSAGGNAGDSAAVEDGFDQEFLDALPESMRAEVIAVETAERRRREREERRRQPANADGSRGPAEIDPENFFAALDPNLRQQLLMEVDAEILTMLPPEMAEEARALGGGQTRYSSQPQASAQELAAALGVSDVLGAAHDAAAHAARRARPSQYVQIQDKAGVATLLRLLFVQQSGTARQTLHEILRHICQNKQNRAEVVSIMLSILQDGSNDLGSVERSFSHLSIRAKQVAANAKMTPQPKKQGSDISVAKTSEMSPVLVVTQCLEALTFLTNSNTKIVDFFLTEHETSTAYKPRSSRKGKGKDTKAGGYPINALLSLLDRKLLVESSQIMESLASLLQHITAPLGMLAKKKLEERKEEAKKAKEKAQKALADAQDPTQTETTVDAAGDQVPTETTTGEHATNAAPTGATTTAEGASAKPNPEATINAAEAAKKTKGIQSPPEVTDYNLRLVVNIIAARECSSKTFKNTLALITHLSIIPNTKKIFGEELIHQAQTLGDRILTDLKDLLEQVKRAESGHEVQGAALQRFSPASSDQAKLLRVTTALNYIFDPKRKDVFSSDDGASQAANNGNILLGLFENDTFGQLWATLSSCLTAIRERGNMMNVATILLPLIEVLMVVCKNPNAKDASTSQAVKELVSSPVSETPRTIETLFFAFTDEHRKIINELVRHTPKLMSGSFSLLVENSKVLEFDNKRNFFQRQLHNREQTRPRSHPTLQVNVRRDTIFLDSFRSLYFKKPEEFKYGKLNVRFQGEEGVDAGGLTREWFQVLVQQIFNPNYALFNPMASDRLTYHPNSLSGVNEEHLTYFSFVGRVIGKALYESRPLDCHFSRAIYKRLLGLTVSVKDMEAHDPSYYGSLKYILENNLEDSMLGDFTFSAETEAFGTTEIVDLVPNGRNMDVTDENKREYVKLIVEHKLINSISDQLNAFLKGKSHKINHGAKADIIQVSTTSFLPIWSPSSLNKSLNFSFPDFPRLMWMTGRTILSIRDTPWPAHRLIGSGVWSVHSTRNSKPNSCNSSRVPARCHSMASRNSRV